MTTEAQIALARRIADETIPEDSDAYATHEERMADWYVARDAALAAIQATTEAAASWLDRLSTELITPDFLAFVGDPFGYDGQCVCADLAQRIRSGDHLHPHKEGDEHHG